MSASPRGWFVTGTDTGCGKTLASTGLLEALRREGHAAVGFKPVAAGDCTSHEPPRNADALALQAASAGAPAYADVNPCVFREAAAPATAAAIEGRGLDLAAIEASHRRLAGRAAALVCEGAGGWRVPLGGGLEVAGLARRLGYPVLVVVGLRLGSINHACLTADAVRHDGLELAGWIANCVDPDYEHVSDTITHIGAAIGQPPLAVLPWMAEPQARAAAWFIRSGLAKLLSK